MVKCAKVCATPSCVSTGDEFPPSVSGGPAVTDDEDVESGPHVRSDSYSPLPADTVSVWNCVSPQTTADHGQMESSTA